MARVTKTTMTDSQRAVVQRRIDARRSGGAVDIAQTVPVTLLQLVMGVVLGMFLGVIPAMAGFGNVLLICMVAGTALGAVAGISRLVSVWRRRSADLSRLEQDLAESVVQTSEFDVADAVRLGGEADHGASYFLDVTGSGDEVARVLFLNDPFAELLSAEPAPSVELDDEAWAALEVRHEEETGFPRRRVRLSRTLHARLLVGLQCEGEPVKVSRRLDPGLYDAPHVDDGELIETTLDELCNSMRVD